MSPLRQRPVIIYELQARYAPGESWITLPDPVGIVEAIVRRFLEHDKAGAGTTSWGVEFTNLTIAQRAHISRLVFTAARAARDT